MEEKVRQNTEESTLIGITKYQLEEIVRVAAKRGYEEARKDMEQSEWLTSRAQICAFLSPEKPISTTTFNRNRASGMYGTAIIGNGIRCKARKSELLEAIQRHELTEKGVR